MNCWLDTLVLSVEQTQRLLKFVVRTRMSKSVVSAFLVNGLLAKTGKVGSSAEVGKQFHAALRLGGGWSPSARNRLIPSSLRMGLTVMNRSLRRSWS